jgi:hypothetical protein
LVVKTIAQAKAFGLFLPRRREVLSHACQSPALSKAGFLSRQPRPAVQAWRRGDLYWRQYKTFSNTLKLTVRPRPAERGALFFLPGRFVAGVTTLSDNRVNNNAL